jgi:ACT domain-containing protein
MDRMGADRDTLDRLVHTVTHAAASRLQSRDPAVIQLVVQEVVRAMSDEAVAPSAQPAAVPTQAKSDGKGALDNGDGTFTSGLGAVLPVPFQGQLPTCGACVERMQDKHPRAVVTATGRDQRGVVATLATAIAKAGGNIADMRQSIVGEFFTMMMVVNIDGLLVSFAEFKRQIEQASQAMGLKTLVVHEDLMKALQRV